MKAALFDVGDTLVEGWRSPEAMRALARDRLVEAFGDRDWYEDLLSAPIEPVDPEEGQRQETLRWIAEWFRGQRIPTDGLDLDRLRATLCLPLDAVARLAEGAAEALRWCKSRRLAVIVVTNTLWRGDDEVRADWERFGLAECLDGAVSSHDVGWRKPHRAMFERALALGGAAPAEAFMVGDRLRADVWGAQQLGLRTIWRRAAGGPPQSAVEVVPDATVDSLLELPAAVAPWL